MKTRSGSIGNAENGLGCAKHEHWTRRAWYRRKWVRERKTLKLDPAPSVTPKIGSRAQNMKMDPAP
jgi:hypothetical protein